MSKKKKLILFLIALGVAILVARLQSAPGYMDADYYFAGGMRLAEGHGFTEEVLWNYLDDPQGLPHPSHTYWMPLTSIFASIGISLFSFLPKFKAAQIIFILVASLIPIITSELAMRFFHDANKAFFAGLLAIFSGFYLPYITNTDSFALYMLLGGLFFLGVFKIKKDWHLLIFGLIIGLMHMTRADGLIWLLVACYGIWLKREDLKLLNSVGFLIAGYLLIAFPWLWRNLQTFGSLMPSGGSRSLFLSNYDALFSFPANTLTIENLLSSGFGNFLLSRWEAILQNLQTGMAIQGLVFLGPLALFAAWKEREKLTIRMAWFAWLLTFFLMSIVFPFSGARGGFFHSGAAFMPLIWVLSVEGLDIVITWLGKKRNWKIAEAKKVFQVGIIVLSIAVSSFLVIQKSSTWTKVSESYSALESELESLGAKKGDLVLVNNPPSYFTATGRSAIVIPNGDLEILSAINGKYNPQFLLLEFNHPKALNELYQNPHSFGKYEYIKTYLDQNENNLAENIGTHIFRVTP